MAPRGYARARAERILLRNAAACVVRGWMAHPFAVVRACNRIRGCRGHWSSRPYRKRRGQGEPDGRV